MGERFGPADARQTDAALTGLAADPGRLAPDIAAALGAAFGQASPVPAPAAGAAYSLGEITDLAGASALRRDAEAAAARHPAYAHAPPARRPAEFLKAHAHYRSGEMKDAITDANNAFESTLKTICDQRLCPLGPCEDGLCNRRRLRDQRTT